MLNAVYFKDGHIEEVVKYKLLPDRGQWHFVTQFGNYYFEYYDEPVEDDFGCIVAVRPTYIFMVYENDLGDWLVTDDIDRVEIYEEVSPHG